MSSKPTKRLSCTKSAPTTRSACETISSKQWAKLGGELVADEAFKTGDVEFRAQLTKIKDANPDVIIMPFLYKEVALATKQARDLGITATFIGGDGWPSSELPKMAGAAVEGSYFTDHTDVNMPQVQDIAHRIQSSLWQGLRGQCHHGSRRHARDSRQPLKKPALLTRRRSKLPWSPWIRCKGYTGEIKIDPKTHNPIGKSAVIMLIKDGKFELFKVVEPMK